MGLSDAFKQPLIRHIEETLHLGNGQEKLVNWLNDQRKSMRKKQLVRIPFNLPTTSPDNYLSVYRPSSSP